MHIKPIAQSVGLLLSILFLISCAETLDLFSGTKITDASWDENTKVLEVNGTANKFIATSVELQSARDSASFARAIIKPDNSWKVELANPSVVPCSVQINNDARTAVTVKLAPDTCDSKTVADISINTAAGTSSLSPLPDGSIIHPSSDQIIKTGDAVFFTSLASVSDAVYQWDFDGGASNINIQNPGKIVFSQAGTYRVKLSVTNSDGIIDPTPAERLVTVLAANNPVGVLAVAPPAEIISPLLANNINVGDRLFFVGNIAPTNERLIYQWDFDNAAADSSARVPGYVSFLKAGSYRISLTTIDALGVRSLNSAFVDVNVSESLGINQAPTGIIQTPLTDSIISVGDTVNFSAAVTDPENNSPFSYLWQFDNAFANETVIDPGAKTFDTPGVYKVIFTATDALGQADTNPPSRFITVNDVAANNADLPESTITSPAMDMTIVTGDSVDFAGVGDSVAGNLPLTFLWNFGGAAAPDSTMDIPGLIPFDMAGVYTVTFTATDSLGQPDPTPAQVIITVEDPVPADPPPADPVPADTPVAEMTPDMDVEIVVGDAIDFSGMGSSPVGNDPVTYLWTFGGAAPDFMDQNPGLITFDTEGVFEVILTVTDSTGLVDPIPPSIMVTVTAAPPADPATDVDPAPANPDAPVGLIDTPAADVTITVGDSVDFAGSGTSPVANDPVTFLWSFDGGAPDFMDAIPGLVAFNMEGIYEVTLTVTDSLGVADPMPPTIIVTVEPAAADPAPPADPAAPADPVPADPAPTDAPTGEIASPEMSLVITIGDSVEFIGDGDSPTASPLTFLWDFGGAAPEATVEEPGMVLFDVEGIYTVTLTVTDEAGLVDPMPPTVEIVVEP